MALNKKFLKVTKNIEYNMKSGSRILWERNCLVRENPTISPRDIRDRGFIKKFITDWEATGIVVRIYKKNGAATVFFKGENDVNTEGTKQWHKDNPDDDERDVRAEILKVKIPAPQDFCLDTTSGWKVCAGLLYGYEFHGTLPMCHFTLNEMVTVLKFVKGQVEFMTGIKYKTKDDNKTGERLTYSDPHEEFPDGRARIL
jgi:hypothetical protein